jgi:hypothetical protein
VPASAILHALGKLRLLIVVLAAAFVPAASAAGLGGVAPATSPSWSGYTVYRGLLTGARARWIVPTVSGKPPAHLAIWVGVGGWGTVAQNANIVQIGTLAYVLPDGTVQQRIWYEFAPPNIYTVTNVTVRPGDQVAASVVRLAGSLWRLVLRDLSSGHGFQIIKHFNSLESSGDAIVEDPESAPTYVLHYPLARFGPVPFSAVAFRIGARWWPLTGLNSQRITLIQHGHSLAFASPLSGDGFSVTRG